MVALAAILVTMGVIVWWTAGATERRFGRVRAALDAGDLRRAAIELRALQRAALGQNLRARALTLEGEAYYRTGRFLDAEQVLGKVLAQDPGNLAARRWLAATFYDLGASAYALEQLQVLSRQDPADWRADRLMGKILKDHEQFGRALAHYREALRRNPTPPEAAQFFSEFAETLFKQNEFREALQFFERCPESAEVLVWRYRCVLALGEPPPKEYLERALNIDHGNLAAIVELAKAALASNAPPSEIQGILQRAIEAHPYDAELHFLLSQAYNREQRHELAESELTAMRKIQQLRREFFELRDRSHREPANSEIRCRMGDISRKLGDEGLAQQWYRAALGADPANETARRALAEMMDNPPR